MYVKLNERSRLFLMYAATKQGELNTYADGQTGVYFDILGTARAAAGLA